MISHMLFLGRISVGRNASDGMRVQVSGIGEGELTCSVCNTLQVNGHHVSHGQSANAGRDERRVKASAQLDALFLSPRRLLWRDQATPKSGAFAEAALHQRSITPAFAWGSRVTNPGEISHPVQGPRGRTLGAVF